MNKQLEHRPLELHREFWNEAIERTDLSRLLWWPALPSKWLEDWLQHELLMREFGQSDLEHEGMCKLVQHPKATAQLFFILLSSDYFLNQEYEWDYPGLRAIYGHPNADEEQKRRIEAKLGDSLFNY